MAGDGIEFKFTSNERDLLRGAGDAESALEDVADALDDVAKAGEDADQLSFADTVREAKRLEDAGEDAGKAIDRSMGRAADETDQLERRFKDAERRAKDLGDAGERAGRDVDRGMERASDGVDELRDEANSTAREAAASFDGSAESIADAFQEIAANAFAGFGPAGAVAGLAAAAGIGLALAAFEGVNEASEESKQRAAEWGQAFIEAGDSILSSAAKTAAALDIVADPERYQELIDNAREWGVSQSTALAAMTGEAWALGEAEAALAEREREVAAAAAEHTTSGEALVGAMSDQAVATRDGRQALDDLNREIETGIGIADTYSQYLTDMARNTDGATHSVDEFGDSVYSLPDGTTVYVDAETGRATRDVDAIERRLYGIPDATADVHVNTSSANDALTRWMRQRRSIAVTVNTIVPPGHRNVV